MQQHKDTEATELYVDKRTLGDIRQKRQTIRTKWHSLYASFVTEGSWLPATWISSKLLLSQWWNITSYSSLINAKMKEETRGERDKPKVKSKRQGKKKKGSAPAQNHKPPRIATQNITLTCLHRTEPQITVRPPGVERAEQ